MLSFKANTSAHSAVVLEHRFPFKNTMLEEMFVFNCLQRKNKMSPESHTKEQQHITERNTIVSTFLFCFFTDITFINPLFAVWKLSVRTRRVNRLLDKIIALVFKKTLTHLIISYVDRVHWIGVHYFVKKFLQTRHLFWKNSNEGQKATLVWW